jgi:transposase-like protein
MPKRTFTPEQIVAKLRQIDVLLSQGKTVPQACKEAGIVEQTFYRWRKEYGGLQMEQAKKLKDLQKENAQLRRAVADLTVEKQILKDIAETCDDSELGTRPFFSGTSMSGRIMKPEWTCSRSLSGSLLRWSALRSGG